jgi:hypothetical protein
LRALQPAQHQPRAQESLWGDADDRVTSPADERVPADDLRIGAEPLLPALVSLARWTGFTLAFGANKIFSIHS